MWTALKFTLPGWDELQAEHRRLANAASLLEGVGLALDSLSEGEAAAEQQIGAVSARLASLADYDSDLQPTCELVESAVLQLQEATHSLRRYLDHLEADPARLNEVEAGIEQVLDTARKYRVKAEQLPDLLSSAQTRLGELGATADPAVLEQGSQCRARTVACPRSQTQRRTRQGRQQTGDQRDLVHAATGTGRRRVRDRPDAAGRGQCTRPGTGRVHGRAARGYCA